MKLRMRSNSVRLRLTQSEVDEISRAGSVSEVVRFGARPDMSLTYSVACHEADYLAHKYLAGALTIYLPIRDAKEWADSDRVGFREVVDVGNGEALEVTVEKDFKCLTDRPGEDESDAFPHPKESHGHSS